MTSSIVQFRGCVLGLLALCLLAPAALAQPADWHPESEFEGKFDWVKMTSGEWVKGEIIAMYDESLEFDSDEFDDLTLDWDDIAEIRTSQVMNVGFVDGRQAVGVMVVQGDQIIIYDDEPVEAHRDDVLTLTAGAPKEINYWSMKVFFGLILREGNSDVVETNIQANFKRRTIKNRILVDFVGNQNRTEGIDVSDNQRANVAWDKFINKRFFVKPISGEYFRDPFQNIGRRLTGSVGAGYQLIDSPKVDWEISGGAGYQETVFDSVQAGTEDTESTPVLLASTRTNWDITSWMEFDGQYRFQVVNEESGTYNHHMVISFETEVTSLIDFDIAWIWDRIQDPRPDENGITPEKDDFRTTVGLTFEF